MANINFSNLGGFIALFLTYIAVYPLLDKGVSILLPMVSGTEKLIIRAIPLVLGLAILTVLWDDEEPVSQGPIER
ncbi:MAG: hypothetical protein ABEJ03_06270 [Candidatus Nanohaloarchaea archaeon]